MAQIVGHINLYRDLRTGTQYIGNWAFRVTLEFVLMRRQV